MCINSPLTILRVASAWPLVLGFLGALVLWSNFQYVANSENNVFPNCGPLSMHRDSGISCSANNFMIDIVFAALHCDAEILQMISI